MATSQETLDLITQIRANADAGLKNLADSARSSQQSDAYSAQMEKAATLGTRLVDSQNELSQSSTAYLNPTQDDAAAARNVISQQEKMTNALLAARKQNWSSPAAQQKYEDQAKGITPEPSLVEKYVPGFIRKPVDYFLKGINAPLAATTSLVTGENPIEAIKAGREWSEVLRQKGMGDNLGTSALGLGMDLYLDPINFIPVIGQGYLLGKMGVRALQGADKLNELAKVADIAKSKAIVGLTESALNPANILSRGQEAVSAVKGIPDWAAKRKALGMVEDIGRTVMPGLVGKTIDDWKAAEGPLGKAFAVGMTPVRAAGDVLTGIGRASTGLAGRSSIVKAADEYRQMASPGGRFAIEAAQEAEALAKGESATARTAQEISDLAYRNLPENVQALVKLRQSAAVKELGMLDELGMIEKTADGAVQLKKNDSVWNNLPTLAKDKVLSMVDSIGQKFGAEPGATRNFFEYSPYKKTIEDMEAARQEEMKLRAENAGKSFKEKLESGNASFSYSVPEAIADMTVNAGALKTGSGLIDIPSAQRKLDDLIYSVQASQGKAALTEAEKLARTSALLPEQKAMLESLPKETQANLVGLNSEENFKNILEGWGRTRSETTTRFLNKLASSYGATDAEAARSLMTSMGEDFRSFESFLSKLSPAHQDALITAWGNLRTEWKSWDRNVAKLLQSKDFRKVATTWNNWREGFRLAVLSGGYPRNYVGQLVGNAMLSGMSGLDVKSARYMDTLNRTYAGIKDKSGIQVVQDLLRNPKLKDWAIEQRDMFRSIFGEDPGKVIDPEKFFRQTAKNIMALGDGSFLDKKTAQEIAVMLEDFGTTAAHARALEQTEDFDSAKKLVQEIARKYNIDVSQFMPVSTTNATFSSSEALTGGLTSVVDGWRRKSKQLLGKNDDQAKMYGALSEAVDKAGEWFEQPDLLARMTNFKYMTEGGMSTDEVRKVARSFGVPMSAFSMMTDLKGNPTGGWKMEFDAAAAVARAITVDYAHMPAFVKLSRNVPFLGMPFASFGYAMWDATMRTVMGNPQFLANVEKLRKTMFSAHDPNEKAQLEAQRYDALTSGDYWRLPHLYGTSANYMKVSAFLPYYGLSLADTTSGEGRQYSSETGKALKEIMDLPGINALGATPEAQLINDYLFLPLITGEAQNQFGGVLYPQNATPWQQVAAFARDAASTVTPSVPFMPANNAVGFSTKLPIGSVPLAAAGVMLEKINPSDPSSMTWIDLLPSYTSRALAYAWMGRTASGMSSKKSTADLLTARLFSMFGMPMQSVDMTAKPAPEVYAGQ